MNPKLLDYKRRVWLFLENLKPGNTYTVAKLSTPETRDKFVAAIKEYMDSLPAQGFVTFNSDYSKFYRITPPDGYNGEKQCNVDSGNIPAEDLQKRH